MRLSRLKKTETDIILEFGEDKLQITYNPSAYTAELEETNAKLYKDNLPGKVARNLVLKSVLRWDLMFDLEDTDIPEELRGKTVPLSDEGLKYIPVQVLAKIYGAIQEDQRPNGSKSEDSGSF